MTSLAAVINQALYGGSPFEGLDLERWPPADEGWLSGEAVMDRIIDQIQPLSIVEVGTFLGQSAIHMTRRALRWRQDVSILCVDTWLGSSEHWLRREWRDTLRLVNGYPSLYHHFLANVARAGLDRHFVPLPMTSRDAAAVLREIGLQADLIYLDAGHDEASVREDIANYWPFVRPGGAMFGDDYEKIWPGVVTAVDDFLGGATDIAVSGIDGSKWVAQKAF